MLYLRSSIRLYVLRRDNIKFNLLKQNKFVWFTGISLSAWKIIFVTALFVVLLVCDLEWKLDFLERHVE